MTGSEEMSGTDKGRLAILLGGVGGYVDAVGYLALFGLFTAHQSGNSVGLGVAIGQGQWGEALRRVTPVGGYVAAVGVGALIVELSGDRRGRRPSSGWVLLLVEAVLLGAALAVGDVAAVGGRVPTGQAVNYYWTAALLAAAMGMQTVVLGRVGGRTVRTTFVTGVLTTMAEAVVAAGVDRLRRMRSPADAAPPGRTEARRLAGLLARLWMVYLAGGVLGAVAERAWSLPSLGVPMAVIVAVAAVDQRWPLRPSLPDDREGSER